MSNARRSLVLLLLLNMLTYMDRQVLAAVEQLIQKDLMPDDPNAQFKSGLLATAFLVSYMAFSPAFGILGDRFSRWALVALGTIVGSLATGATGLAASFAGVLLARIVVGISEAAYAPVAPTLLADLYPVEQRGRVLAWFYAAIPVGSALGYVFGGLVADLTGSWRWAFYLLLPPGVVLGALAFFMPDPRPGVGTTGHVGAGAGASPGPGAGLGGGAGAAGAGDVHAAGAASRAPEGSAVANRWRTYLALFRIPSYSLNVAGMTAMTFALGGIAFWMPRYIFGERQGGASLAAVNFWFGAIAAGSGLAATLIGGWLGDKLRGRLRGSYFLVSASGAALGFPCFILVLVVPFPWAWIPLAAAVFCLFLNTGPTNTALANVTAPPVRATAFALSIFILHALGDAISPPLIGLISDRADLTLAMALVCCPILLASVFWFLAARTLDRDTAEIEAKYPSAQAKADVPMPG